MCSRLGTRPFTLTPVLTQAFPRGRASGSPRAAVSMTALRPGPDHALLGWLGTWMLSEPSGPFPDAGKQVRQGAHRLKSQDTPSRRSCRGGQWVAHSPLHLPLVSQVRLVAHQHDDHIAAPLRPDIINPLRGLLEGVEIWRWKVGIKLGMRGGPAGEGKGSGRESVHPQTPGQGRWEHRPASLDLPENAWVYLWNCAAGPQNPSHC